MKRLFLLGVLLLACGRDRKDENVAPSASAVAAPPPTSLTVDLQGRAQEMRGRLMAKLEDGTATEEELKNLRSACVYLRDNACIRAAARKLQGR